VRYLKKWKLPVLTAVIVLAAVLLPRQISALRDRGTLGVLHTEPLSEEDLSARSLSMPEKLELLGRAIWYPDLEIFSTTQSLPSSGQSESGQAEQAEAVFFQAVEYLTSWGILPESFDASTLKFEGGSRAVYMRGDEYQSVSVLYLQGGTNNRDSFWLVADEETGLPIWIDCSLRSVQEDLPESKELGTRFLEGLGVEFRQRGPAMWEIEDSGGLIYSAQTEEDYGRISVEPMDFAEALFGEETDTPAVRSK
jgi:hypothetical protein